MVFVRSGYIRISSGRLGSAGFDSDALSSMASNRRVDGATELSNYRLALNSKVVYSAGGPYDRWFGIPLRCLSTV